MADFDGSTPWLNRASCPGCGFELVFTNRQCQSIIHGADKTPPPKCHTCGTFVPRPVSTPALVRNDHVGI